MVTGAFSLVCKAGLILGIEHPRHFGALNTFPRCVWAHTHPLSPPQPRPPGPGHLTTLSVFSCPFTHPSFLPTYLPTCLPSDRPSLRPSCLLPSLATLSSPQCSSFFPRSPSPSMSVVPAFSFILFFNKLRLRAPSLARISTSRRISPYFFLFFPFFISGSVSRFSNLLRCPPSSSNQSLCQ